MTMTRRDPQDRITWGLVLLVYVGTLAFGAVWLWWMGHPSTGHDLHSPWTAAHRIAAALADRPRAVALCIAGVSALALTTAALSVRSAWGAALALTCSVALIAVATEARTIAVFSEPRGYVERSAYVRAATSLWLPMVALHLVAAWLALRALRRGFSVRPWGGAGQPDGAVTAPDVTTRDGAALPRFASARAALGLLALLCPWPLVLWAQSRAEPLGAMAVVAFGALAVGVVALIAMIWPRRGWLRAAWLTAGLALVASVPAIALALQLKRHHRGIYIPAAAADPLLAAILAAPPVIAILALAWAMAAALRAPRGHAG